MRSRELLVDVKKLKNSVGDLDQLQIDAATNIVDALNGVKNSVEQVEVSVGEIKSKIEKWLELKMNGILKNVATIEGNEKWNNSIKRENADISICGFNRVEFGNII